MKEKPVITDFISDMLDSCRKARRFAGSLTYEEFVVDDKTVFAVVRALEIIGEAAKQIPTDVRQRFSALPWRTLCGMRDKLIHSYKSVNYGIVWNTLIEDLPALELQLEQILNEL